MRKFMAAVFSIVLLLGPAASTTIDSEEVRIDLATRQVDVSLEVEQLTSETLSYITSYPVSDVTAKVNNSSMDCQVSPLQLGSEIRCDPPVRSNFTADLEFRASQLIETRQQTSIFRYTHTFYRPTESFTLHVTLPKGAGLLDRENVSSPVISPTGAETGSNGRRIFVEWNRQPELGETVTFQVMYQSFSAGIDTVQMVALAALAGVMALAGFFIYRRLRMEDIENVYEDLDDDEISVVELLRENDGSMLQKDVVDSLDYSKAKISGVVSGLVEREVLRKKKEGRSNRLAIAKNYRA